MFEFDHSWDAFVIYVNAYYAVQEAYDSARRNWERPAPGLKEFVRDANPFLWDERSSAEPELYEGFAASFDARFGDKGCSAQEGRDFARTWLLEREGDLYGHDLANALDSIADERAWEESCEPVARQIMSRSARIERTPQDEPVSYEEPAAPAPSAAQVDAVIDLLAKGDEDFAAALRARLANQSDEATR